MPRITRQRPLPRIAGIALALVALVVGGTTCPAKEGSDSPIAGESLQHEQDQISWSDNYKEAMQQAKQQHRMLLIHFMDPAKPGPSQSFLREVEAKSGLRDRLADCVLVRLPMKAEITTDGRKVRLLGHPAFAELEQHQGLVLIDYVREETEQYGRVVSTLPFANGKYYQYSPKHVAVMLDLPPGTPTQRARCLPSASIPSAGERQGGLGPPFSGRGQAAFSVPGRHPFPGTP